MMTDNYFSGPLPMKLLNETSRLEHLHVSNNQLNGSISLNFSALPSYLGKNSLHYV